MSPRLSDELERDARRFDRLGGRDLGLDEVLGRARGIRRRRSATVLVAVAAVVTAIAVPAALLTHSHEKTTPDPTHLLPTIDRIGLGVLPVGDGPRTGWLQGNAWHDDGHVHELGSLPGPVVDVAPVADSVLVAVDADRGNLEAHRVPIGGDPLVGPGELGAMTGGFARSPKGGVVAFAGPDGRVVTVQDGDTETFPGPPGHSDRDTYDAVSVTGEDCHTECQVWLSNQGAGGGVSAVGTTDHNIASMAGLRTLADVSVDGKFVGPTSVTDTGSCSAVTRPRMTGQLDPLWHTCDARFLSFSPKGNELLGSAAYGDGFGDSVLTTFDAQTGRTDLDLRTEEGATITQMRWEDDDHVLAVVYEDNRWGVLRIGLDRTVEYAIAPVAGTTDESPFLLPD